MNLLATALLSVTLTQAKPTPLDPASVKAAVVLTDGAGHYIALDQEPPSTDNVFYGDGKAMYRLRVPTSGSQGNESWSLGLWDPRVAGLTSNYAGLEMKDSGQRYALECGRKVVPFTRVADDEAKKLLAGATFLPPRWTRRPERLLRDDHGTYYFVDLFRAENREDRRDFRVFVGPRGNMKQVPLKDVVDDAMGLIFATKDGALRLVANADAERKPGEPAGKWVKGKGELKLIEVPLDRNDTARLVYMDLGPYTGQRLGTPCDDSM